MIGELKFKYSRELVIKKFDPTGCDDLHEIILTQGFEEDSEFGYKPIQVSNFVYSVDDYYKRLLALRGNTV